MDGTTSNSGQYGTYGNNSTEASAGGSGGAGGGSQLYFTNVGAGGGGLTGNGVTGGAAGGGMSYVNGGAGGVGGGSGGAGGYGGGGGGDWFSMTGGGGGGGYSGGGGGEYYGLGGGGGSYNIGSNQSNTGGVKTGHGQVVITQLSGGTPPVVTLISPAEGAFLATNGTYSWQWSVTGGGSPQTQVYNLPSTSFAGWQSDPCGTVDRGTPTAGQVDTGSWTDTLPVGSVVTNIQVRMRSVYDGGSSTTIAVNGTFIGTIIPDGGAGCDNNSYMSVNAAPGAYTVGGLNQITLTNNGSNWNIWDRNDPSFGYVEVTVTYIPTGSQTQIYNLPSTSFAGWQNDACATVDRGTPTAGLIDTGSWTDTLPVGSVVTNIQVRMRAVYDGGSSTTIAVNGTPIGTMVPDGGAGCDNNSYMSVNAAPGAYTIGGLNQITLTNNNSTWNIWDRDDPTFGYVEVTVTYTPPGGSGTQDLTIEGTTYPNVTSPYAANTGSSNPGTGSYTWSVLATNAYGSDFESRTYIRNMNLVPTTNYQTDSRTTPSVGSAFYYNLTMTSGRRYVFATCNHDHGQGAPGGWQDFDTRIIVYDSAWTQVANNDDCGLGGLGSYINYTCPASGTYYVRVGHYTDSGNGSYTMGYKYYLGGTPGLWTGTTSTDWFTNSNWSDGNIPGAGLDVTIPIGCPNYPNISSGTANCYNLTVNAGGSLTVSGGTLNVTSVATDYEGLNNYGTVNFSAGTVAISKALEQYGGTLTISGTAGVTVGSYLYQIYGYNSTISMSGGTVTCNNIPNYQGTINHSGGTIYDNGYYFEQYADGGVYYGSGTALIVFQGATSDMIDIDRDETYFQNVTIATNRSLYEYGAGYNGIFPFDINGNLTINPGATLTASSSSYNIEVAGNWTNDGGFTANSNTVTFNGSSDSEILGSTTTTFYYLYVSKSAASWNVIPRVNVNCTMQLHVVTGIYNMSPGADADTTTTVSNSLFYVYADGELRMDMADNLSTAGVSLSSGAAEAVTGGTITLTGGGTTFWAVAGSDFTPTGGAVVVAGSCTYSNAGTVNFYDLTLNGPCQPDSTDANVQTLDINGSLLINGGGSLNMATGATVADQSITIAGNWTRTGGFSPGGGTVTFDGSGNQTIGNTETYYGLTINKSGGNLAVTAGTTVTAGGAFTVSGTTPTITSTTTSGYGLTLNGNISVSAANINYVNPLTIGGSGAVTFNGVSFGNFIDAAGSKSLYITRASLVGNFTGCTFGLTGARPNGADSYNVHMNAAGSVVTFVGYGGAGAGEARDYDQVGQALWGGPATWTAGAGTTNWSTPGNWSTNNVPDSTTDATIAVTGGASETPWRSNENGTLFMDNPWNYTLGYKFTPSVDGMVTALAGFFNGTKLVRLWRDSGPTLIASAWVTSANAWSSVSIAPVALIAGESYRVAVDIDSSGGAYRGGITALPQAYGNITIQCTCYQTPSGSYPTNEFASDMYGMVDIAFVPGGAGMYPILTADSVCQSITINPGTSLSLSSYTLSVYGSFTNNGTLYANTGTIAFAGTDAVANTIGGTSNSSFFILEVLRTAGSLTLAQNITVASGSGGYLDVDAVGNVGILPSTYEILFSQSGNQTFSYTGAFQTWVVPAGVTSITVDAYGAEAGFSSPGPVTHVPGKGGRTQATLTVTPGATLYVYVG
ncbi:MAG: pre-peptidase C-terminal domain-containing protein, partial [Planctomycetota bacterium]|nr:pre-peptidase C-terminal domain-containing protein [Planctomycetota bacterium]